MKPTRVLPKRWFYEVKSDVNKLPDALEWYLNELEGGFKDTEIDGNLESLNRTQPGFVAYYDAMHTDLDMILEFYERQLRLGKASKLRQWSDQPPTNAKLSVAELKLLIEGEEEIKLLSEMVEEIKYVYKQYGSLLKSLEQRGFSLNNIVKLRVANLEEVEI